jgi:hypothetical protein
MLQKGNFSDAAAAVDAMAALQARIGKLEKGNVKLRKERDRIRALIAANESEVNDREAFLVSAAEKAQQMLDSASATIVKLRDARREQRRLQSRLEDLNHQLQTKLELEAQAQERLSTMQTPKEHAVRLVTEYEDLFCELLSPPNFTLTGRSSRLFSPTTHLLPTTLRTAVQMLQTLPVPFRDQTLEKKRQMIATMLNARRIASKITDEIQQLELLIAEGGNIRKVQAEVDVKSNHLAIVTEAMTRFRFD